MSNLYTAGKYLYNKTLWLLPKPSLSFEEEYDILYAKLDARDHSYKIKDEQASDEDPPPSSALFQRIGNLFVVNLIRLLLNNLNTLSCL